MIEFFPTNNGMIDFGAMGKKQAELFMKTWVATTPERQKWLGAEMVADNFPALREDIESLKEVAEWLTKRAKLREGNVLGGPIPDLSGLDPAKAPMWYDIGSGAWSFDDWTMWAIDAAALNFGSVMTKLYPDVTWVVAHEQIKQYIDQNHPCLIHKGDVVPHNPINMHLGVLFRYMMDDVPGSESIQESIGWLLDVRPQA